MGIRFACHSCQHALHVKDFLGGKRGKCPDCGISFQIPSADAQTSIPISAGDASESPKQESPALASSPAANPQAAERAAWYLRIEDGQQFGPVDEATFQTWVSEGRVTETSHVWRDGWPEWQTAPQAFPAQFAPPEASPPVAPPPVTPPAVPPPAAIASAPSPTPAAASTAQSVTPAVTEQSISGSGAASEPVAGLSPIQRARIDRRLKKKRNYQLMLVGLCVVAVILVVALILVVIMQGGESAS